jgi:hypothetical protein
LWLKMYRRKATQEMNAMFTSACGKNQFCDCAICRESWFATMRRVMTSPSLDVKAFNSNVGEFEEYEGEAADRGVDQRGFNLGGGE